MTSLRTYRSPGPEQVDTCSSSFLRSSLLVGDLFAVGELRLVTTDLDRMTIGGAVPAESLRLPPAFLARRELGVINIGTAAIVRAGADEFELGPMDTVYIGAGGHDVEFASDPRGGEAVLYLVSCPAHHVYPSARVRRAETQVTAIGDASHASRRCIRKAIHPGGIQSCQLVMGFTELQEGSVWNTMPPHTHERRSEIYLYLGLEDGVVIHLVGPPDKTRSLIVHDRQAVLSPAWSVHTGAGTRNYRFVWAMAGENQTFDDMDGVPLSDLA